MVMKKVKSKTVRKATSKKPFSHIAVAKVAYGPYPTKQVAQSVLSQVAQVPRCRISPLAKTSRGYTFSASVFYGLKSVAQKSAALATIKKHAPNAKVTFRKA